MTWDMREHTVELIYNSAQTYMLKIFPSYPASPLYLKLSDVTVTLRCEAFREKLLLDRR
jgi:hypothetical protein